MPKRLRNLVSAEHKRRPPAQLAGIAAAEGRTPTSYCRALRRSLWGGSPEASIVVRKYGVSICTWSGDRRLVYEVGSGPKVIHLGFHQNHYVLLSQGFRSFEETQGSQGNVRGGVKGEKSSDPKEGKREDKKEDGKDAKKKGRKLAKTAKRITKAVQADLAKKAEEKEKRREQLKVVTQKFEDEFEALRSEIGGGGVEHGCRPIRGTAGQCGSSARVRYLCPWSAVKERCKTQK